MLLDPGTVTHQSIGFSIFGTSSQIFLQLFIFYHILIVAQSEIFYNHFIFGDKGVHTYGRINIWKYI